MGRRAVHMKHLYKWETFKEKRNQAMINYCQARKVWLWVRAAAGHVAVMRYAKRLKDKVIRKKARMMLGRNLIMLICRTVIGFRKFPLKNRMTLKLR